MIYLQWFSQLFFVAVQTWRCKSPKASDVRRWLSNLCAWIRHRDCKSDIECKLIFSTSFLDPFHHSSASRSTPWPEIPPLGTWHWLTCVETSKGPCDDFHHLIVLTKFTQNCILHFSFNRFKRIIFSPSQTIKDCTGSEQACLASGFSRSLDGAIDMTFSYDEMNLYVVTQDDKKASIGSFFLSFFLFSPVLFLPARFIDCLSSHAPLLTA